MTSPQAPEIRKPIAQRLQAMGLFDHAAVPPVKPQVTIMEKPRTLGILTFILLVGLLGSLLAFTHLTQPDWPARLQELRTTDWPTLLSEAKVTVVDEFQSAWAQISGTAAAPQTTITHTPPLAVTSLPPSAPGLAATMDNSPAPLPEVTPVATPAPAPATPVVEAAPPPPVAPVENHAPAPAAPTVAAAPSTSTAPITTAYQPVYYYPPNPYYYAQPPQPYYYQPYYYQPPAATQ